MRISAGMGDIDDLPFYAQAGADEVFVGYVPGWWVQKYGIYSPLNRREVLYYNVQIGSASELEILAEMAKRLMVRVTITLNALYYLPEQYPLLSRYIRECLELGFDSFIVADMGLLFYLSSKEPELLKEIRVSVSGELGEMNRETAMMLSRYSVKRIIFHRKMTLEEMKACVIEDIPEYEAFALNEMCHFHGGFCHSLHCDEMVHACRLPYKLVGERADALGEEQIEDDEVCDDDQREAYIPGETGCAFCKLWDLRAIGITHLKLVGRGNYADCMVRDIEAMRRALEILEEAPNREDYIRKMKADIFPGGCSGMCY